MRIAVPLAIPVALGLTIGIVVAVSGGNATDVKQSALGASASPSASASATTATTTVPPANSFNNGPLATFKLGDVANAPVSGAAGATPINLHQTPAEAANSMNCTIAVPANPLSARGLETPWQLGDGCSMANAATEGAFVEATILAPNGQLSVYNPLVITAGTTPAAKPAPVTVPFGSVVEISVGFNGVDLALTGFGANQGNCVDALGESLIGQVSTCNAVNFYNRANADIARGTLKVPPVGTSLDGQACLVTRNFGTIDQDPSDNTDSEYLINGNGQTEQATPANVAANGAADTALTNGSDDALLSAFLDPANGCKPFTATDVTAPTGASNSQVLNELSSKVNTPAPEALIPVNDEMVLVNGNFSIAKTNVYRSMVDQPLLLNNVNTTQVAADFCQNMVNIQPARNQLDMARELNFTTPVAATGNNLATFMGNRLSMSFANLNCQLYGLTNPVNVTVNGNQVAIAITYNLTQQTAKIPAAASTAPNPTAKVPAGRRGHRQNPSGM